MYGVQSSLNLIFSRSYCYCHRTVVVSSVCPSVRLSVTKCIVALMVEVGVKGCTVVFLAGHSYSLFQTFLLYHVSFSHKTANVSARRKSWLETHKRSGNTL